MAQSRIDNSISPIHKNKKGRDKNEFVSGCHNLHVKITSAIL
jgi:hypothetical protein